LDVNGEAIYDTQPTLFGAEAGAFSSTEKDKSDQPKFIPSWNWRSTTAADKIYVEIFNWPTGRFHLDKLPRNVSSAYLLADPTHALLKLKPTSDGLDVELPAKALDPVATVLVLNTEQ
jgi:alpha-L-fucosidase